MLRLCGWVLQFIYELDTDKTESGAVPQARERSQRRRRSSSGCERRQSRRGKAARRSKLRGRVRRAYYGNGKKYSLI